MTPPFLDIARLSCGYGSQMVLKEISFSVQKGDIVTIIGPNGCGKTTLLKTLPGLIPALGGRVNMQGQDMKKMPRALRARTIAMVMQTLESIHMTVEEYVLLGRLPHFSSWQFLENEADRDLARSFMTFTHIDHLKRSPLSCISSGERQLAGIAKALVQEPALLLMDEPTSHLDISHQAQILNRVKTMKDRHGLTVVMVQHDLNLASEYSDQVVLLDKNTSTVFKYGTPEAVITRDNIRAVYHTDVVVAPNPHSGRPGIFIKTDSQESISP
jgi:iron complex transport system ATP-binding protein